MHRRAGAQAGGLSAAATAASAQTPAAPAPKRTLTTTATAAVEAPAELHKMRMVVASSKAGDSGFREAEASVLRRVKYIKHTLHSMFRVNCRKDVQAEPVVRRREVEQRVPVKGRSRRRDGEPPLPGPDGDGSTRVKTTTFFDVTYTLDVLMTDEQEFIRARAHLQSKLGGDPVVSFGGVWHGMTAARTDELR